MKTLVRRVAAPASHVRAWPPSPAQPWGLAPPAWPRHAAGTPGAPAAAAHPLADAATSAALQRRAEEIDAAFARIEPVLRALAPAQFDEGFPARAAAEIETALGVRIDAQQLQARWSRPLALARVHAECVIGTFCRLVEREFDRTLAALHEGEPAEVVVRRFGFHAIDITPCADGRLAGVVDYILRLPPSVVAYRKSYAGAMFDVEEALRHWEAVELRRWREGVPNAASEPTRFLKIGVYHFSSVDPAHEGCAAHGSDDARAAGALLERLQQFDDAVRRVHGAAAATLLIGVDTDTDALRVHVPDASGAMALARHVCSAQLYERTAGLDRESAKAAIRDAVAACAGTAPDDAATQGMRWLCGWLLKNNLAQVDAVRRWHGGRYAERGHTERLIVVGDAVDDVQLRNLAFQAQMDTVEEGGTDLDVGIRILEHLHVPRGLAVPVLVHYTHDARVPASRERAVQRAQRLAAAVRTRHRALDERGDLVVGAVVRAAGSARLEPVPLAAPAHGCGCTLRERD